MTYPIEVQEEAIYLRSLGHTFREISEKCGVSDDTARRWFESEGPEAKGQANNAKLQRHFDEITDAAYNAARRLNDEIDNLEPKELIGATRATSMAVDSRIRLLQDERKVNSQLDVLREHLRTQSPAQLRSTLAAVPLSTMPVIQVLPKDSSPCI